MRVHGQKGLVQGHGAEQGWLPFFAEGDRRGKLLPFQPDGCPSLLSGLPAVRRPGQGGVGPGGGYVQGFQDGPGHLGECGPGVHQGFQLLESLAVLVAYLNRYPESSHSCPLHLRELHGWVVAEPAVSGAEALLLRGLGLGAIRCAKPPYYHRAIAS